LYPNPANNEFFVRYTMPEASDVKIDVYTMEGVLFKSVFQRSQQGANQIKLSTADALMPSGVYVVKFATDTYTKSVLLKVLR